MSATDDAVWRAIAAKRAIRRFTPEPLVSAHLERILQAGRHAGSSKNLQRFRVRTPTFANIPAMLKLLQGCELADVPVLVLTIDPCISCTER